MYMTLPKPVWSETGSTPWIMSQCRHTESPTLTSGILATACRSSGYQRSLAGTTWLTLTPHMSSPGTSDKSGSMRQAMASGIGTVCSETRSGMIGAWRTKLERSVWPSSVVVGDVPREGASRVPFAEDQDAVGELGSGGPDEAFGEVVRSRAARWDLDGVDPGAGEGGVEGQFRAKPGSAQGFTRTNGDSSVGYPLVPGACGAFGAGTCGGCSTDG
jgi:hypothetical protein